MKKLFGIILVLFVLNGIFSQDKNIIENTLQINVQSDIEKYYGKPLKIVTTLGSELQNYSENEIISNYYYNGFKIWTIQKINTNRITNLIIVFYSPLWMFKNNITIGSKRKEIIDQYGQPLINEQYRLEYNNKKYLLQFNLNGEQLIDQICIQKTNFIK